MQSRKHRSSSIDAGLSLSDLEATGRVLRAVKRLAEAEEHDQSSRALRANPELIQFARHIKAARTERNDEFGGEIFGEPSWDMLLALYIADGEGYRLKVSNLCIESNIPTTTALRWIKRLIELDLIVRRTNQLDARSSWIEISPAARTRMGSYLAEIAARYFRSEIKP